MRSFLAVLVLFFAYTIAASRPVLAFPENIRYNYVNCTTCHISPTGGGITTQYGRALSNELMSTFGSEDETKFLYGLVTPPSWLNLGGDIRAVQYRLDNPTLTTANFIRMQTDLEAEIKPTERLSLVGTIGLTQPDVNQLWSNQVIERRYYALFHATDEISLRAGKFLPAYGIYTPNHTWLIRRDLGFDEGTETYNLETAWINENFNVYATGIFGNLGTTPPASYGATDVLTASEVGGSAVVSFSPIERFKAGASYYYGSSSLSSRSVMGPFVMYGITQKLFALAELDFQLLTTNQPLALSSANGAVSSTEIGYELYKGVIPYSLIETSRLDFTNSLTQKNNYGLGIQLMPRPHFEFNAIWLKRQIAAEGPGTWDDYAYIMFHYYF